MEWLELLKDENIMTFLADYTVAIGFVFTVLAVVAKMTKTKKDDQIIEALKGKFRIVPK